MCRPAAADRRPVEAASTRAFVVKKLYLQILVFLSRRLGAWVVDLFVWPVTTAFFLFRPQRVGIGLRFYRALYPDRSRLYHLLCTWRQYHRFAGLFHDRLRLQHGASVSLTSDGWEHLERSVAEGRGGIILMSHMGSWEMAAGLFHRRHPKIPLLLFMGRKHQEKIGAFIKKGLSESGVKIVAVDRQGGSALEIIEGINFLKAGGLISLTGDRPWSGNERTVAVRFLGHEVRLLEAPHVFALLSGAPILIFFAFRTAPHHYRITVCEPIYVTAAGRSQRQAAIQASAQRYADQMEKMLHRHPLEWYHFEPFLGRPLQESTGRRDRCELLL
jgi:predicted LPLAT superfamily acyltransferase